MNLLDPRAGRLRLGVLLLVVGGLAACRNASDPTFIGFGVSPNESGANGCSAPDVSFATGPVGAPISVLVPGSTSAVTAVRGAQVLYATGVGGTIVELDVSDPLSPVETTLVSSGVVAALLATEGVLDPPQLSGISVLSPELLVVAENTSNTLLVVERGVADSVAFFAGEPNTLGGFADGLATGTNGRGRFSFYGPLHLAPSGTGGDVLVADPGNHALRLVSQGTIQTVAGQGFAGLANGTLSEALFDTPSGLTITCSNVLLVSELGDGGFGHQLRAVGFVSEAGSTSSVSGDVVRVTGDGTAETTGDVALFGRVARPVSPLATLDGSVYWIDSQTGILRRLREDQTDCPLWSDCATAVAGAPEFTPGGNHSLTQTDDGAIWVLDADAAALWRVAP
jgi:hypothetical protein